MVLKDMPVIRIGPLMLNFGGTHEGSGNFVPFRTILPYLLGEKGLMIAAINIIGNIILLVPIGFLLPLVFQKITWKKALALAIAAGLVIEGSQVILHVGIFDIDDVILNGLGVMIGYWAFAILASWMHSKKYKTIAIASILVVTAAAATVYAIYPKGQQSVDSVRGNEKVGPDHVDAAEATIAQGDDPCKGTGGTGQIVSVGTNTITIKRGDGTNQTIKLTDKTKIRTSMGPLSQSDLKMGNHVTVVIDNTETAAFILVCNEPTPQSVK